MNTQQKLLSGREAALAEPWRDRRKVDRRPPRTVGPQESNALRLADEIKKVGSQERIALRLAVEIKQRRARRRERIDGTLHRIIR